MTVICKECGAKMPTNNILELHMVKRHGGKNEEVKTVIKPEDRPVEATSDVAVIPVIEVPSIPDGMVEIISADGRVLEVSIGKEIWNGKTIMVPKNVAEDVRRILEEGGFYLKN